MIFRRRRLALPFLFMLLSACATPPPKPVPNAENEAFLARAAGATSIADRWALGAGERLKIGLGFGYVAAIRENGTSLATAVGNRTIEPVTKLTERDLLEIGSITKTFTGILIHLAELEGKLRRDQTLAALLPELKGTDVGEITVAELALHRSGLPREPVGITIPVRANPRHGLDRAEVIAALAKQIRSPIPPGESERKHVYSNWGYLTLGLVLENAYHRPYPDLLRRKVLDPLGMRESGVARKTRKHGRSVAKAAPGFALDGDPLPLRDYDSFAAAVGGLETSAADMTKFLAALENPPRPPLGRAIEDALTSGFGWDSAPGVNPLWKNGATTAHTAFLLFDRIAKRAIFVASNTMVSADELGFFAAGVRPQDDVLALGVPKREAPAEEIARLKGKFRPPSPLPSRLPNGFPELYSVEAFETFGRLVARYSVGAHSIGALLVPEAEPDVWRVVDGMDNVAKLRLLPNGLRTSLHFYRNEPDVVEVEKVSGEPEKYPAQEK